MQNFAFKFQAVAEKTAKKFRGLLYFAAPCSLITVQNLVVVSPTVCMHVGDSKKFWDAGACRVGTGA